jgi:hypothetical protein
LIGTHRQDGAIDAHAFELEPSGLTVKDREPIIGRPHRACEVRGRERPRAFVGVFSRRPTGAGAA